MRESRAFFANTSAGPSERGQHGTPNAGAWLLFAGCPVSFFGPACAILQLFQIPDRAILFVSDGPALLHSSPGRPLVRRIFPSIQPLVCPAKSFLEVSASCRRACCCGEGSARPMFTLPPISGGVACPTP